MESPVLGQRARRVRRAGRGNGPVERSAPRLVLTLFRDGSYGYRPKRRAEQAVTRVAEAIVHNKTRVIDLDLANFLEP